MNSSHNSLHVGVAGLGTVGGGTVKLLQTHREILEQRAGKPVMLTAIADPRSDISLEVSLDNVTRFDDALALTSEAADVDVVVELIGGSGGIAKTLAEQTLRSGKHLVTANKALLAHHGTDLARLADDNGVILAYEAAVGGGIPIIKALRDGLAANAIGQIQGILNGTCNYILSEMRQTGREFDEVLREAQKLGYAEADPSFDVDGVDTAHKLALLSALAFGVEVNFDAVHIEGIRQISSVDIEFAEELGYRIKLLGTTSWTPHGIEQRVHPTMVPLGCQLANVEGVFNAVVVDGDFVDTTMFYGRGAGERPTASAVVADLIDIARGNCRPTFTLPAHQLQPLVPSPMSEHAGSYYVRLLVADRPGVFKEISTILSDQQVSIESILQRNRAAEEAVPVVMTLHETKEAAITRALGQLAGLSAISEPPHMIRIETTTG